MKPIVHTFAILFVIGSGSLKAEGKELKVLFIGNSLTNRIRNTLDSVIQASPYSESTFEYVATGGWTLQKHMYSENTMSKIRSSDWDFVVLQENTTRLNLPEGRAQFYNSVANLSEAIKESGAQVVLYMTWGWRDSYEPTQQRLVEAYNEAARQVDAIIAPVGVAWQLVRRNKPDLGRQLYSDDIHPSYKGAFLTACVFYATLFDADPTELAFNGGLSDEEAAYFKTKAKEAFIPIFDFNGDEIVDINDLLILIEHWGTDEPSVDIAPPFGDGIVDVQDLELLMSYWQQEVLPVSLLAYWKLDETEGDIAHDSAGNYDGTLNGNPVWQPTGGQVDGALAFDGTYDYVSTPLMLDPENVVFSVFAWIKGGMPGQVVFSQAVLSDWLGADTTNGGLMTELRFLGKTSRPLQSATLITDGNWHRIGLVWDGSNRVLYVDDVQVASDTYDKGYLVGDLQIGGGKNLDPSTFWFGLIDDVRIYKRAITKVATEPNPANGAERVPIDTTLSWRPGLGAATHDVYFGTSSPPAFIGNQAANRFDPGPLELNTTYYWQVAEVEADGTTIHKGNIWSFNVPEAGLVGLWKLDEPEGSIARDSAGDNDGTLNGEPLWQPTGGQIDGALAFDGIDDYVSTDFVLNPADGEFSVFAWIRGGAPGQVFISQTDIPHGVSVNWLCADPSEGKLMTEFKSPSRDAPGLLSQTVITDGNWHRVGFMWDGSNLTLYVDDVEEAADSQVTLAYSTAGLHIGAGSTLEPGSFFSGLIDDVRIYDRAITP